MYEDIFKSVSLSSPLLFRCLLNDPTISLSRYSSYVVWYLSSAARPVESFSVDLDESYELVHIPDVQSPSPLFRLNNPHADDPKPISPHLKTLLTSPVPPLRWPATHHAPVPRSEAAHNTFSSLAQQSLPLPSKKEASVIFSADVHDYLLQTHYPRERRPTQFHDLKELMSLESSCFAAVKSPLIPDTNKAFDSPPIATIAPTGHHRYSEWSSYPGKPPIVTSTSFQLESGRPWSASSSYRRCCFRCCR
jgi:hypothetical protein